MRLSSRQSSTFKVPIQPHSSAVTAVGVHFVYLNKNSRAVIEPLQSNTRIKGTNLLKPYLNIKEQLDQTFQKHLNVMYVVKANVDFLFNDRTWSKANSFHRVPRVVCCSTPHSPGGSADWKPSLTVVISGLGRLPYVGPFSSSPCFTSPMGAIRPEVL